MAHEGGSSHEPQPPSRWRRPEFVVATIAAVAAIAGTIVGAAVTYVGNRQLQDRQLRQEEARESVPLRASARLLQLEYRVDFDELKSIFERVTYMAASGEFGQISHEGTLVSRISEEDRKLLAGRLSLPAWQAVVQAEISLANVERILRRAHSKGAAIAPQREQLKLAYQACDNAYEALMPLVEGKNTS